jgi:hypothetical protein
MAPRLALYEALLDLTGVRDLEDRWDFRPLHLEPAEDHDMCQVGGWRLGGLLQRGEASDASLYVLWPQDGRSLDEAPVVLASAVGRVFVVAEDLAGFLALMDWSGGQLAELAEARGRSEIEQEAEHLRRGLDPGTVAFGRHVLHRLGIRARDRAGILLEARKTYADFHLERREEP